MGGGWGTPPPGEDKTHTCENNGNKKVLLRERKRHTACYVASTRCAALSNPDLVWGGGT